jgi:ADP-ribose pyrophosphatase YjhB (NUDIX family)
VPYCQRCGGETAEQLIEAWNRPVCTQCGFVVYLDPKLAVAVVIERNGAILLGKRGANTREPGRWSFPAGFVDRGEAVEDAAIREVQEETGLAVDVGPLLGLFSRRGETVVLAAYAAASATGDPVAGDDLERLDWFDPGDPPDLAFPHDSEIISAWQALRERNATETRPGAKS